MSVFLQRWLLGIALVLCAHSAGSLARDPMSNVSPAEVKQFFDARGKTVITFVGYSGAGYEDIDEMLQTAREVLSVHSPAKALVNIGATSAGIGAVYEVARKMGFETTGVVSTQAKKYNAEISPHVDTVFYVTDDSWGGFRDNTEILSPTSQAMAQCSDIIIGIGGGAVSRDEMIMAKRQGKTIKYIPADMNHKQAMEKARQKGMPVPTEFQGAAYEVFAAQARKNG